MHDQPAGDDCVTTGWHDAETDWQVLVHTFDQPQLAAWQGGSDLAVSPDLSTRFITKADYHEAGHRDWG